MFDWRIKMHQRTYVVGNKFSEFSVNNNVVTIGQLMQRLALRSIDGITANHYILSQGLSAGSIMELRQTIKDKNIQNIQLIETSFERERAQFVHKAQTDNVLIAKPIAISNTLYVS